MIVARISRVLIIISIAFSPPHLDFGGRVAPAQFSRTARNDTEWCPYLRHRAFLKLHCLFAYDAVQETVEWAFIVVRMIPPGHSFCLRFQRGDPHAEFPDLTQRLFQNDCVRGLKWFLRLDLRRPYTKRNA
jgi:hypothetical protein